MSQPAIPEGCNAVTPYLVVADGRRLVDFLQAAFAATVVHVVPHADGGVRHAHLRIGDSSVMLGQSPEPRPPAMLYHYTANADATYRKALEAGATSVMAPIDQPYGDRAGAVKDPAGNEWWIASRIQSHT